MLPFLIDFLRFGPRFDPPRGGQKSTKSNEQTPKEHAPKKAKHNRVDASLGEGVGGNQRPGKDLLYRSAALSN